MRITPTPTIRPTSFGTVWGPLATAPSGSDSSPVPPPTPRTPPTPCPPSWRPAQVRPTQLSALSCYVLFIDCQEEPVQECPHVCRWGSCAMEFCSLESLVTHIRSDHILQVVLCCYLVVVVVVVVLLYCAEGGWSEQRVRLPLGELRQADETLQGAVHAGYPPAATHRREAAPLPLQAVRQGLLASREPKDAHPLPHRYSL